MADNGRAVAANAMAQSEHERLKMEWDQSFGPTSKPFRHEKTSVLQLSFADDDLQVGPELSELGRVFRDVYGFKVQHEILGSERPGQQAMRDLSKFVYEEDDAGALLIIYYAGHGHSGNVGPGDICMEGAPKANSVPKNDAGIEWSRAEPAIRYTKADVLLIFDCCDAGRLARPYVLRGEPKSYFQFLGACSENQPTRGPSQQSFTSALIWALEQFAKKAAPFSTADLRAKIMKHEHFPDDQMPVLSGRREPHENITICVKGAAQEGLELAPSRSEREKQMWRWEHIDLRFHFEDKVDSEHIEETAIGLKTLLERRKARWTRVSFLGKSSLVQRVATKWKETTLESRKGEASTPAVLIANGAYPAPVITDIPPTASPAIATAEENGGFQLPSSSMRPTGSPRQSREGDEDNSSSLSGHTEVGRKPFRNNDHESIAFHLRAIARNLRSQLSAFFSRIAKWLMPRSDYERIPDEPV